LNRSRESSGVSVSTFKSFDKHAHPHRDCETGGIALRKYADSALRKLLMNLSAGIFTFSSRKNLEISACMQQDIAEELRLASGEEAIEIDARVKY
jgi:hypothetical protein